MSAVDMVQTGRSIVNEVEMNIVSQSGRHLYKLLIGAVEQYVLPPNPSPTRLALRLSLCTMACTAHSAAAQRRQEDDSRGHLIIANIYEWVKHSQYRTGIENAMSPGLYCSHS
jgi:hypothetical protein